VWHRAERAVVHVGDRRIQLPELGDPLVWHAGRLGPLPGHANTRPKCLVGKPDRC
jgi:hypothetical protein